MVIGGTTGPTEAEALLVLTEDEDLCERVDLEEVVRRAEDKVELKRIDVVALTGTVDDVELRRIEEVVFKETAEVVFNRIDEVLFTRADVVEFRRTVGAVVIVAFALIVDDGNVVVEF